MATRLRFAFAIDVGTLVAVATVASIAVVYFRSNLLKCSVMNHFCLCAAFFFSFPFTFCVHFATAKIDLPDEDNDDDDIGDGEERKWFASLNFQHFLSINIFSLVGRQRSESIVRQRKHFV